MATLGLTAVTLSDFRKREHPDGHVDFIIEALEHSNPILEDMVWKEGNLRTGNKTTIRTSIPRPSIRLINRGVSNSKSTTRQVEDTCMSLEDRSVIDVKLLNLYAGNAEGYRRSEDAAFVQGFSDVLAENLFYGDTAEAPGTFNGISIRYNQIGGKKNEAGYQVIAGGTANEGAFNTSAFLIGWGTSNTTGIYPKGSSLGLQHRDLGEGDAEDADGLKYRAVTSLFSWDAGLAVQNIRANALVRNIDVKNLPKTSAAKLELIEKFVVAKNRIINPQRGDKKLVWYVGAALYDWFELYLLDKNNVHVTRQELANDVPRLYFSGIEIKRCDAISETEPAFTVNP